MNTTSSSSPTHTAASSPVGLSRRDFARTLAFGGVASLLAQPAFVAAQAAAGAAGTGGTFTLPPSLPPAPAKPDEAYWRLVRAQFVMPPDMSVLNAANLCPSPWPVLASMVDATRSMDRDPSFNNRKAIADGKETTRRLLAEFLGATPEEIIITRNTSEANNMVSLGLDLRRGDEIILFGDNHPCNMAAWEARQQRYGFSIVVIPIERPHPGGAFYVDALKKALTPRTKLVSFTHHTNTMGDLFPAKEICALARDHGALSLMDGAQSFGLIDFKLSDVQPDFYSASAHKWLCGPKEVGVLYVASRAHAALWPSIVSSGNGAVGLSKTHEAFGQRDEPAIVACGEAVKFQLAIGRAAIEARSRELGQRLMAGLAKIDGVSLYTSRDSAQSLCVVVFKPGDLSPAKLAAALYENDRIGCTARSGERPGLRISPHFYNLPEEVDRTVASVARYMKTGLAG